MPLLDWLYALNQYNPFTHGQTTGVAQDRYTHTPMVLGSYGDLTNNKMVADYATDRSWGDLARYRGVNLSGIPANTPGSTEVNTADPGYSPSIMRHEIIHAATLPDLDPKGDVYRNVNRALPDEVKNNTHALYSYQGIPHDVVHESVPMFLTDDKYKGKEYNADKLKVINAFPAATKAKLTRIMAMQQGAQ